MNNISIFNNVNDYLPILNGAILTDMFVLLLVIFGFIKSICLNHNSLLWIGNAIKIVAK